MRTEAVVTRRPIQSPIDMARGGGAGYFKRTYYPETVELLQRRGSLFRCLDTHFRGTGDYCEYVGVPPFINDKAVVPSDWGSACHKYREP